MARRRGNSWQGSLKTPEKYYRYSFATQALAEEWEQVARLAHKAGVPIPEPTVIRPDTASLHDFYERNKDVIWAGTTMRTQDANQRSIERFFGSDTLLTHITTKKVTEVLADMLALNHKPSTINSRLSHLQILLRHAKALEVIDHTVKMPFQKVGDNSRLRFLTEEEERKILSLFRHWGLLEHAQIIEALIDTGCRPGELLRSYTKGDPIKWSEVSVSAGGTAPDVNDPKSGQAKAVISLMRTKNGKYRVIPLTERAQNSFLASKQRGDKRPFGDMRTDIMSQNFRNVISFLNTDGSYDDVVLYTLRHTCASRLVQRGADLMRVMQWMGHNNVRTTLRYAKLTPTDIFELEALL